MTFVLKPEIAAVVGPFRAQTLTDAMATLTGQTLEGAAWGAKLDLQRELFDLVTTPVEEKDEP